MQMMAAVEKERKRYIYLLCRYIPKFVRFMKHSKFYDRPSELFMLELSVCSAYTIQTAIASQPGSLWKEEEEKKKTKKK